MYPKSVLTDWSHIMTGCGRVGQNRLLDQVELHTTGCVQFDPVFRTLRKYMNRLRFRFDPKREKNRTEPDFQTLQRRFGRFADGIFIGEKQKTKLWEKI
jgi:hypothetical protein